MPPAAYDAFFQKASYFYIFGHTLSYIIPLAMEVYIEYALAENFCMDFCLLYAAKAACKNRAGLWRISIAAALGACFAVLFPLFGISGWLSVVIKIISGALLCLAAGAFSSVRGYLKFTAVFTALTFALGGALIAVFSLSNINYSSGGGVILSSVPVGIPLFAALMLVLAVAKIARRFVSKNSNIAVTCCIYAGQSSVSVPAFFDSGNKVYRHGSPVSVLPQSYAQKLIDVKGIKTFVTVHTVAGGKKLPVFTADKVEIHCGEKVISLRGVTFCVAEGSRSTAVLHPDLAEAIK